MVICTTTTGLAETLGGCFNTGAGQLNVTDQASATLTLNPAYITLATDLTVVVLATKATQTLQTQTRLYVVDGEVLNLDI